MQGLLLLVIFLISICYAVGIYPAWKGRIVIYVILVVSFATLLYFLVFYKIDIVEHLQISSEAIQNVGSIYNTNKMVIKDLELTGELSLPNGWKISTADKNCTFKKGDVLKETIDADGNLLVGNTLKVGSWTMKDNSGELQFLQDGGGSATFQKDGNMWTQPTGSYKDNIIDLKNNYVKYGQKLSIHGNSGMLDNHGLRCNDGDGHRDIGVACQEGIGQGWSIWQFKKQ